MKRLISILKKKWYRSSESRYVSYLRKTGIHIGANFKIRGSINNVCIDITRPSLVSIGDDVEINRNFTLLTHDMVAGIFRKKFHDFLPSSGHVRIGNNVRFGVNCTVLKNVTIGDNCFIAAGAIVTKDIPSDSIAAGVPAKVVCSIEDYYNRRKIEALSEAFAYAKSIKERYGRLPHIEDFYEEFPFFVNGKDADNFPMLPIRHQLGVGFDEWSESHMSQYESFEAFLADAFKSE